MSMFKKLLSGLLVVLMASQTAVPIFAYSSTYVNRTDDTLTVTDSSGNEVVVDESWEETYPTGTFAFNTTQVNIAENGESGSLILYRLGGSLGRAVAKVNLIPGTAYIDDDTLSYAYAAGRDDYLVEVENPAPSAVTDSLGGTPTVYEKGGHVWERAFKQEEIEERGLDDDVEFCYYLGDVTGAYDFRWQIKIEGSDEWKDISGANEEDLPASREIADGLLFTEYDVRVMYKVDGVDYCSVSVCGEEYTAPDSYEVDGWEELAAYYASLDEDVEFSPIIFEGEEYDSYSFYVVFAEGEDEKEIRFTAIDDELHEAREVVNVFISEAYGATLYDSANVATVAIEDDEPELPSAMGLEASEIWADMSEGVVRIPLVRTAESSEAFVYVTGADYTVEEGSAVVGRDYAATEDGTALFPADLDYSAIEITLVNDGNILSKEDSDLYFTVRLTAAKGGGSSTLIDGKDTITVRLYNSGEGNASNIASKIYSEDEVDVTLNVNEGASVVSQATTILATADETVEEVAYAEYELANYEDSSRVIDYGKITFKDANGNSVVGSSSYWKDYYMPYNRSVYDSSNTDNYGTIEWNDGEKYGNGWRIYDQKGGAAFGKISNLYTMYSTMDFKITGTADKNMGDYSKLGFKYSENGTEYSLEDPNKKLSDVGYKSSVEQSISHTISSSDTGIGLVASYHNTGLIKYDASSRVLLEALRLRRREMTMPTVKLYTADDDKIYASGSIKNQTLYDALKPSLTMDAGKGGVSSGGKMYIGSEIKVNANTAASATYSFATTANGAIGNSVKLYSTSSNVTLGSSTVSGQNATISTLISNVYANDNKEIRIYMDRSQTITLDVTPSVARKTDENGNLTNAIDETKLGDTWSLIKKKTSNFSYNYKELNSSNTFASKDGTIGISGYTANAKQYKSGKIKNLQSINFGLSEDDVILFNGKAYKGNADIAIPESMYLDDNLTFYYYDKEYLNVENIMSATISRIECYLDIDEDGTVEGTLDEYGVFNVSGSDILMRTITADTESLSISTLAPQLVSASKLGTATDEYRQVVLKVYYTMLPRCLVVPEGHSETDTAEVVPAIVTSITDVSAKNDLSAEQKGYRYIDHSGTGDGKLMFGAEASGVSYVDIPLGGDLNPAYSIGEEIIWEPEWKGNPYEGTEFTDPDYIALDGTALGDRYAVGEMTIDSDGSFYMKDEEKAKVSAYLSAMHENDRFALCVREAVQTKSRSTDEPEHYLEGIESSTLSGFYTYPSTVGVRTMTDPYADENEAGFDMKESSNPMDEYNMDGDISMPEIELGLSDYVTIGINGQEMSISVGANLIGFEKNSEQDSTDFENAEMNSTVSQGKDNIETVKKLYNTLFTHGANSKDGIGADVKKQMDELRKASAMQTGSPGIKSMGFEGNIAFNMSMVLKWNPLENRFFFSQLMIMFSGELQFSFTARLTPIPIFYVTITVGVGVELATGLERQRVKVRGETYNLEKNDSSNGISFSNNTDEAYWTLYEDQDHMGQEALDEPENGDFMVGTVGSQMKFKTKAKAIDIYFSGSLSVDAVDSDGNRPSGFTPGVIKSSGDEAVTVKLAKSVNGGKNDREYTVTLTVVEDKNAKTKYYQQNGVMTALPVGVTILDNITTIEKYTDDVYFAGLQLSPSLFMEVAVGVGIEMFKIELFINISVSASFGFITHDSPDYSDEGSKTTGATVNEFSFVAGVGLRVTALFFNFEFNAVQFAVNYDRDAKYDEDSGKKSGWSFTWYAANQEVGGKSRDLADDPLKVRVVLPGALADREQLYTAAENADTGVSRAFDPTDKDVPFQYSGYGTSGDAFTLGEDLLPGSTYELVTVGDTNYIVYTVSRTATDTADINVPMLVLSKIEETATYKDGHEGEVDYIKSTSMGTAHPSNTTGDAKYLILDNDGTGDLDFDVWTDGDVIRVAWVSYTAEAAEAYTTAENTGDTIDALAAAATKTVVKTVDFDTVAGTLGTVEQVSPATTEAHGIYTSPSGAGDMIFYAEAVSYTEDELTALLEEYADYVGGYTYKTSGDLIYGDTDPTVNFRLEQKKLQAAVYGKSFYPTYAYKADGDTAYTVVQVEAEDWINDEVNLENAALCEIDEAYYAAYTTAQYDLSTDTAGSVNEEVIRKLYLQKITVSRETTTAGEGEEAVTTETITIKPDSAVALRKLYDNRDNDEKDGVYSGGTLSAQYDDPYFANVKFLTGKLGNLTSTAEDYTDIVEVNPRARDSVQPEEFLLFEMNGNTYIVPKADILSITTTHNGGIIPFFTRRYSGEVNGEGDIIATNVTIGADSEGNISAVYTAAVESTSNTALYLTKYDSISGTWGVGTMLAMHDMQVYEDSVSEGWDSDKTAAAYFDGDEVYNFTFGKLNIGLAGDDRLLVLAEGSKMMLEEQTSYSPVYTYDDEGNITSTSLVENGTTYLPATDDTTGGYDVSNGIYALTFGAGEASLGYASISLSNYDFTPGSEMNASVSFTNLGDTAIRASESNPATVELLLEGGVTPLMTWKINDTIRAGQSVVTTTESVTLPTSLEYGKKLYFRVYEDTTYITGSAFDENTLTSDDTTAYITLEERVELGFEDNGLEPYFTIVEADEDTVTLRANIHIGNRGAADSYSTYLRLCYEDVSEDEDGEILTVSPIDLTGHKLSVSNESKLSRNTSDKTLANGYLLLATTENGKAVYQNDSGKISSMYGRTVTGTFTVPKSYFDTDYGTNSLNIRLILEGYDEDGNPYTEYDESNNVTFESVEQKTFFETANNLSMQVGSYLRIPMSMQTTRSTSPAVVVSEITDDGSRHLGILYYDSALEAVVIMPATEGEGKIRVEDVNTNSVYDICYNVVGEGLEINIFDDNGIFTWLDKNGNDGDTGREAWDFEDNIMRWSNKISAIPLRNDVAVADDGEAFTFKTLAESIDLYFMGEGDSSATIRVSSTLDGYGTKTYTSADGTKAVRIDFGNSKSAMHTVTVTANGGKVRFDKMIENFPADYEVKTDSAAPDLFYSRTLPERASFEEGESVTLGVYFVDMGGLASVSVNGVPVDVQKINDSEELWYYEWEITENAGYKFTVVDQSGQITERTLTVDWFSTVVSEHDNGATDITVSVVDKNGNTVVGAMDDGDYYIKVEDESGNPVEGAVVTYIPFGSTDDQSFTSLGQTDENGKRSLAGSAVYRVDYRPAGSDITSTRMLCIDMGSTSYPVASLTYDTETKTLKYSVIVRDSAGIGKLTVSSPIVSVKLDGRELLENGQSLLYFEGVTPYKASGKYTLVAVNANGKESTVEVVIPTMQIELDGEALTYKMVSETDGTANDDGSVTIDETKIVGGKRDGDSTRADYEYALVEKGSEPTDSAWTDDTVFDDLAIGEYELYIRDKNDTENVLVIDVKMGYAVVRINEASSLPTAYLGHTGSITVDAEGGYGELEYSFVPTGVTPDLDAAEFEYDGVTLPVWTSSSYIEGLPEGVYTVTVREAGNHDNMAVVSVNVPHVITIHDILTVPVTVGNTDGEITVNATGGYGTLMYSYVPDGAEVDEIANTVTYGGVTMPLWTENSSATGLPTGVYTVTIRDGRGDTVTSSANVPDHIMLRVETFPTYEDESTGSITAVAMGGYGEFEYCYLPLEDDGTLRHDVVIGTAHGSDGEEYQTITFNGRATVPLWSDEYELTSIPKGRYLVIARDTGDPTNPREYPEVSELLEMRDNRYTAVVETEIRNHDKFEITIIGDIGTSVEPDGVVLVQRYRGLTVNFKARDGYQLMVVLVDGKSVNAYTSYTFENVNEPHTIQIITKQLETIPFRVTELKVTSTEGGSVSTEGNLLAAYGSSRSFKIRANEGWRIADVLVDGKSVGAVEAYEFRAITESHTLHAVFEKLED